MCGLLGIAIGRQERSQRELDQITDMFTRLLLLSEHRGPFATGVARVDATGDLDVLKHPVSARVFVNSRAYARWVAGINSQTTYLMGHTRWPTRGSIKNPENNHPLVAEIDGGSLALSHNGHIPNANALFKLLNLPRTAQVDSELLLRLAQRHAGTHGLSLDPFLADLEMLTGRMSAALVATTRPNEVILFKGNMPLEVWLHPERRIVAYASVPGILEGALRRGTWEHVAISPREGVVIDTHDVSAIRRLQFQFGGTGDSAYSVTGMG